MTHSTLEDISNATSLAIIGMAGRFPGANSIEAFWQNIAGGVKSIRYFSDEELLATGVDPALLTLPNYVKAGAVLEGVDRFDAAFFGYTPREAEIMDPQHRLFLECSWEAFESAGYVPDTYTGLVGVFGGSGFSTYGANNLYTHPELVAAVGELQINLGNDRDSLATMVSYKLNLKGPGITVQTFCSTSLVAIHLACQSLITYECDIALAGGVAISVPQERGYLYEEGGILSPDGECRTFDAHAQGSVMGNGVGVVALKRLAEALADGDHICAVIRGSAVNNDGSLRVSYTAPGLSGQTEVIAEALGHADAAPETITYLEAHGTATMLGDAVELAAMLKAFGNKTQKKRFCAIGSVKPNVGHLDRASGVAGLIKTTLALQHQQLPPSLNFERTSSDIDLENSPFYVNTTLRDWSANGMPRRAGVSSFGLGGTNVHVVVEEAPAQAPSSLSTYSPLLLLSARTGTALKTAAANLAHYLGQHPALNLMDVAYTLQVGRSAWNYRCAVVCQDREGAITSLMRVASGDMALTCQTFRDRPVTFLFPEQSASANKIARELYHEEPIFRKVVDQCCYLLDAPLKHDVHEVFASTSGMVEGTREALLATCISEYALARLFAQWGIRPRALFGSGMGEFVAACLSGVISLEDALTLLAYRDQPAKSASSLQTIQLHPPQIPYISSLAGTWITAEQATNPLYWLKLVECDQPAYGIEGIGHLLQDEHPILLEIGTGQFCSHPSLDVISAVVLEDASASNSTSIMRALRTTLGRLWLAGVTVDWASLYHSERRLRVPLPTYPFERQRYWIDPPRKLMQNVDSKQSSPGKLPDIADWFYRPTWQQAPLPLPPLQLTSSIWLIFVDDCGVGERLAEQLVRADHTVVQVRAGKQFACRDAFTYTLCPGEQRDYIALCQALRDAQLLPDQVVHCWSATGPEEIVQGPVAFGGQQEIGFYSLLYLAQALGTEVFEKPVQICVIANHLQAVEQQESVFPEKKTLLGACTVISQENTNLICRSIDVVLPVNWSNTNLIDQLLAELTGTATEPVLALREGERWVQTYQPTQLPPVDLTTNPLRQRGVYLITGGLGNIGLVVAEYLARTFQARLILLSRSGLPPKSEWNSWLGNHDSGNEISLKIRQVQALAAFGAEVLVIQADVSHIESLAAAIEQVYEKFGVLHGVIHAAGISTAEAFKTVQDNGPTSCDMHFQAKVYGVYALEQVLRGRTLDFCLLFSSISAILGGLSFAGYAAANLFMDAFVYQHAQQSGTRWVSVNWDTWQFQEHAHGVLGSTVAEYAMTPREGVEAFVRILASDALHIVNSTGNLSARLRQWVMLEGIRGSTTDHQQVRSAVFKADVPIMQHEQRTDYERLLTTIWQEVLGVEQVGVHDNYFDLGGNSLNGLQVIARLRKAVQRPIPIVALFEAPTISAMVAYLQPATPEPAAPQAPVALLAERRQRTRQQRRDDAHDIAIIGMSGRFPGADSIEQFWHNLRDGVESLTVFSDKELLAAGVDPAQVAHPSYVKTRPILAVEQVEGFDAAFFGYSPREAELLDPQHRLFLECAWEALERACYDPSRYDGLIGVYAGANLSSYLHTLLQDPGVVAAFKDRVNGYQIATSMDKDALTTTVSYKLNLRGPSLGVQTFCSTSLVAVHLACQSLRQGECDLALAGGVSVRVPIKTGHLYQEGGQESPDGHCRTFDAGARGSTFGDGVGIVVLKRLTDALEDGDSVLAVIKGSAINNDGAGKVSYAAPSVGGQATVVEAALADAGLSATTISYVEAHGTATELGDPIEVRALSKAFGYQTALEGWCGIGSVKTNVGHLDRAAGVTGLIKTVLALQHEQLPASLHYHTANPAIDFAHSPFVVTASLTPWSRGSEPRRAGVNALGMGGTNAHVVVEEAPLPVASRGSRPWQLVLLSARTESALERMASNLVGNVREQEEVQLADVAYSLQVGRQRFAHRRMLLCQHAQEIGAIVQSHEPGRGWSRQEERVERSVVFLLPGVGEPYGAIVEELYQQEETFRQWVDRCSQLLQPVLGYDLRELLLTTMPSASVKEEQRRKQTDVVQPATFVLEYALAQLLMQWGIRPQALLGYSLGEYVAACLAGVFSLEDALTLVAQRAQLIQTLPTGAMLAVALSEQDVQPYLSEQVSLAAINAPRTCVLAGPCTAMQRLENKFRERAVASRQVATTHAFHSHMLEPLRPALIELVARVKLQPPSIPYISTVTGTWITAEQAMDPHYWAEQMCQPVRFANGVQQVLEDSESVVLEVGAGQALCSFVKQHPSCDQARFPLILPTVSKGHEQLSAQAALLATVGKLWLAGVEIDWPGFYTHERRQRVILPTYPFERQRYWIDTGKVRASDPVTALVEQGGEKCADLSDWFYLPSWQQTVANFPAPMNEQADNPQCWLVFADSCSPGTRLVEQLTASGQDVVIVTAGTTFSSVGWATYTIRPTSYADYETMLKVLRSKGKKPTQIVHLWTSSFENEEYEESDNLDVLLERGFYSLITLAQALGNLGMDTCQLAVISSDMYDVTGNEQLRPEKATVLGPCKVIPQEYPNIRCRNIDISSTQASYDVLVAQLLGELTAGSSDPVVALRGRHRWIQVFEPIKQANQHTHQSVFRSQGVYLITGGLGGIGLAMAEYLAKTVQARLVLVGRSALPHRATWSAILSSDGDSTSTGRQIRKILALEALGASVLIVHADVSNEAQMRDAIQQTLSAFGTLHGVWHLAGMPASGLLQLKTQAMAERVLAPKVRGTLVLANVLQDIPLDFLVLFSSVCSATGGGPGQVDYCAANAFLDAYAHAHFLEHGMTVAIDWGEWQWDAWADGLTGYPQEAQQYFRQRRQKFGISFEEGAEALCRVLQRKVPHVVVSTEDFQSMVEGSQNYSIATIMQEIHAVRQSQTQTVTGYARPVLGTVYVAPDNELEQEIAAIWGELLGIEQIGIHDNFFELGGHSLMGTQLMTRLRQSFQLDISLATLFEAPTIAELAMAVEMILIEEIEKLNEGGEACIPMMNS